MNTVNYITSNTDRRFIKRTEGRITPMSTMQQDLKIPTPLSTSRQKWKNASSKPTDIYDVIKPLYYVSNIVGLAPFSFAEHPDRILGTPGKKLWSAVVAIAQLVSFVVVAMWSFMEDYPQYSMTVVVPDALAVFLQYLSCLSALCHGVLANGGNICRLLQKMALIDSLQPCVQTGYVTTRRWLWLELVALIGVLVAFYTYNVNVWGTGITRIYYALQNIANFSTIVFILQFIHVMIFLMHRASILNDALEKQQAHNTSPEIMRKLRSIHIELCELATMTNAVYGFTLLVAITHQFVFLVSSLHYSLSGMADIDKIQSIYEILSDTVWSVIFIFTMLALTGSCQWAGDETDRAADYLQKMLVNNSRDGDMALELELFSMHLIGNKVEFTACGFFAVDFSLLCSITGAITTYLVILFQFK